MLTAKFVGTNEVCLLFLGCHFATLALCSFVNLSFVLRNFLTLALFDFGNLMYEVIEKLLLVYESVGKRI